jgi:lipopolysaccharide biosynthesis glycosyltransferase
MKRNLLVTLADNNYVRQARQLFSSAYWNAGWKGDYMLLSHGIPDDELQWFREKGILIRECEPLSTGKVGENYAPVVFDKFYLFTEEFRRWEHVIFLDSDIIVKAPLDHLTEVKSFAAVQDFYFKKLHTQFYDPNNCFFDKIYDFNAPAFNSGVMAFSTDIITPEIFTGLKSLLNSYSSGFRFGEQPALNLCFYKKWFRLPEINNVFIIYHNYKLPKKLKYPALHFFCSVDDKPRLWDPLNPFYEEWEENLRRSEFIDLNNIPEVVRLSPEKRKIQAIWFKIHIFFRSFDPISSGLKHVLLVILNLPEMLVGQTGRLIKRISPGLYHKLKKK